MASSRRKPARKAAKAVLQSPEKHGEKCLHMHCQQWLVKSGMWDRLLIFHVGNERKGGFGAQVHFKRMGVLPGVADYLAFAGQRRMAIELKDDEGEQSPDQIKFQKRWERAGGEYHLVRTLYEFKHIIAAIGFWI